jgi:hypothetical protein
MNVSECRGLNDAQDYIFEDIYRFRGRGRDAEGRVQGDLEWTGLRPGFADSLFQLGLDDGIDLTKRVFQPSVDGPAADNATQSS